MEGLEITELKLSEINLGDRADPEYYSKENISISHRLDEHHAKPLKNYAEVTASAFYPAATDLYESGEIPFARCVDVVQYPVISKIQDSLFERIPKWFMNESGQIRTIRQKEIIITKVGTPCYAGILHDYDEIALSRTVLGLTNINDINPYYLTVFLRSKYGFSQLMKERELTIQYQLTLDRVRNVLIYVPSSRLQSKIALLLLQHIDTLKNAQSLHHTTQELLLKTLGLENWQPTPALSYERKSSEVFAAGRLDAEYFQPIYNEIEKKLGSKFELKSLGQLGRVTKGITVSYEQNGAIPIIRSGDLSDIEDDSKFLRANISEPIFYLESGDILVSSIGFGSIGKIQVFDKNISCGTVSEVTVIRQKTLNAYFLMIFLRSLFGQLQITHYITGATGQLHLYPKDVAKILIPIIPIEQQLEIENSIRKSYQQKQLANSQLEAAKHAVEIAIEDSEAAALAYLQPFLQDETP